MYTTSWWRRTIVALHKKRKRRLRGAGCCLSLSISLFFFPMFLLWLLAVGFPPLRPHWGSLCCLCRLFFLPLQNGLSQIRFKSSADPLSRVLLATRLLSTKIWFTSGRPTLGRAGVSRRKFHLWKFLPASRKRSTCYNERRFEVHLLEKLNFWWRICIRRTWNIT